MDCEDSILPVRTIQQVESFCMSAAAVLKGYLSSGVRVSPPELVTFISQVTLSYFCEEGHGRAHQWTSRQHRIGFMCHNRDPFADYIPRQDDRRSLSLGGRGYDCSGNRARPSTCSASRERSSLEGGNDGTEGSVIAGGETVSFEERGACVYVSVL